MAYVEDRWKTAGGAKTARAGKGRRWRVRYLAPDGMERGRSFDRKLDADRFRATVEADLLRGTYVDPEAGRITLAAYAETWLSALLTDAPTIERVESRVRRHIMPVLGDKTLAQLAQRPSVIRAWLSGLDLAPTSARGVLAHLSAMLQAAVDDGLIIRNPCAAGSVKRPKVPKKKVVPWTTPAVAAVRAALPARYRVLADLGASLGLRQGETFGLSPDDFNWPRGSVAHIRRQVRVVRGQQCFAAPKGDKERDVPVPESVRDRVSASLAAFPAVPVTLPWREPGGEPVTARLIVTTGARRAVNRSYFNQHVWHPALARAGVPGERSDGFHALRHYFASALVASGEVDIRTVAEYLGHDDPGFTLRVYSHLMPGHDDRMRAVIDGLLGQSSTGPETARPGFG
jgi:integrase